MPLQGLDDKITQELTQEYGLNIKGQVISVPFEILLLFFIVLSAIAGFIVGFYWHKIFKAKAK